MLGNIPFFLSLHTPTKDSSPLPLAPWHIRPAVQSGSHKHAHISFFNTNGRQIVSWVCEAECCVLYEVMLRVYRAHAMGPRWHISPGRRTGNAHLWSLAPWFWKRFEVAYYSTLQPWRESNDDKEKKNRTPTSELKILRCGGRCGRRSWFYQTPLREKKNCLIFP
jgi:hypothetical protein